MIKGITYANQRVPVAAHAALFRSVVSDGILTGCELSHSGSNLTIAAGLFILAGRETQIVGSETVSVTQTAGYARVKAAVNVGAVATAEEFKQFEFTVDYATTLDAFTALKQEDVNASGTVYEAEFAVLSLNSDGIAGIVRSIGAAHGRAGRVSIALPASGWVDNKQTVAAPGVTPDNDALVTYDPDDYTAWNDAGVRAVRPQGSGTLTFACDSAPTADLTALVLLFN